VKRQFKAPIVSFILFLCCFNQTSVAKETAQDVLYPVLVNKFYAVTHQQLFWVGTSATAMRTTLLAKLDSAAYIGTDRDRYRYNQLLKINEEGLKVRNDSTTLMQWDMLFTDAAIAYCKDLYQGNGISTWLKYDEWSERYEGVDNIFIIDHLVGIKSTNELSAFIHLLESNSKEYLTYKTELKTLYTLHNTAKAKQVALSMNFYRWLYHFKFEKCIVVNIGSATLKYYENGKELLFSKMIVGKSTTPTPLFAATCREVILYPYWTVPRDIILKELLPKYKKSPELVNAENMQVLDTKGNLVNPDTMTWARYNNNYFPFNLRQSTGCDNSLGVIKFNLTSPFGVYLHDTNVKGLFKSTNRYRSHGCMRVEKDVALGNFILNNKLDTSFLRACVKGEQPKTVPLEKDIPVLVVYMTAELNDNGVIKYYPDVYHLLHLD
jgi:murein L,D-transpeptidase YcbB/YkuD